VGRKKNVLFLPGARGRRENKLFLSCGLRFFMEVDKIAPGCRTPPPSTRLNDGGLLAPDFERG
jgi:hypothetical protein